MLSIFRIFILENLEYETIEPIKILDAPGILDIDDERFPPVQLSAKEIVLLFNSK